MTCHRDNNTNSSIIELIANNGFDGLGEAVTLLLNEAMKIERARHLKAEPYERTDERNGYSNGYKPKKIKSRIGELELEVPQVRNSEFYPNCLEKGIRSERALKLALAEMYVQGVSTRRVKEITEKLCGFEISSTDVSRATKLLDESLLAWRNRPLGQYKYLIVDARYENIRNNGCVVDSAVLIAYGVNNEGHKHILGVSVSLSENEVHWREFFDSLVKRGLHGIELFISDAHGGIKAARKSVFPSIPWQRCQFHLQQNAQSYVPKRDMKKTVSYDIRSIFNAPNSDEANRLLKINIDKYSKSAPDLSKWMEDNIPQGLTVMNFPESHRVKIRTSNLAERVNKEIKRRTRVAGIFPNTDSCLRLVTAIIMEIDDDWKEGKTYINMN
jgi:transposase-like protein